MTNLPWAITIFSILSSMWSHIAGVHHSRLNRKNRYIKLTIFFGLVNLIFSNFFCWKWISGFSLWCNLLWDSVFYFFSTFFYVCIGIIFWIIIGTVSLQLFDCFVSLKKYREEIRIFEQNGHIWVHKLFLKKINLNRTDKVWFGVFQCHNLARLFDLLRSSVLVGWTTIE